MLQEKIELGPKIMRAICPAYRDHFDHWRQAAENNADLHAVFPPKPSENGKARVFTPLQAASFALMADLVACEYKTPQAAKMVRRVMEAHLRQPSVEQWGIIFTANGNVSTLPFTEAGLSAGYISGSRLKFALIVDLKNYADRVTAAIADAPRVIGGDDGE